MSDRVTPDSREAQAVIEQHVQRLYDESPIGTALVLGYREELTKFAVALLADVLGSPTLQDQKNLHPAMRFRDVFHLKPTAQNMRYLPPASAEVVSPQPTKEDEDAEKRHCVGPRTAAGVHAAVLVAGDALTAEVVSPKDSAAIELLRRLRQWDMFNPPDATVCCDAPYWVNEIDKVLKVAEVVSQPPQEKAKACANCGWWGKSIVCLHCGRERASGIKPFPASAEGSIPSPTESTK